MECTPKLAADAPSWRLSSGPTLHRTCVASVANHAKPSEAIASIPCTVHKQNCATSSQPKTQWPWQHAYTSNISLLIHTMSQGRLCTPQHATIHQAVQQSSRPSTKQASKQASRRSINQSSVQSNNRSINQSVSQSVRPSVSQSVSQSINQPTNQPANQPTNQPTSQSIHQPTNHSFLQSVSQ